MGTSCAGPVPRRSDLYKGELHHISIFASLCAPTDSTRISYEFMSECLKIRRWPCFTVPTIVGRLTRGRAGLEKSFHRNPAMTTYDFSVHTEFGADMWTAILQAGFSAVSINTVEFPAALALSEQKRALPLADSATGFCMLLFFSRRREVGQRLSTGYAYTKPQLPMDWPFQLLSFSPTAGRLGT